MYRLLVLSKQLSRQLLLFFYREGGFKPFKPLRVFVSAGNTVKKSGSQFSNEKIVRLWVIGIAHALGFGRNKARLAVKVNIAGNGKSPCTHFLRFFHGIVEQLLSVFSLQRMIRAISIVTIFSTAPLEMT